MEVSLAREDEIAVIRVEDDGPGIDPGLLPHVFERFRRGDPTPARRHGGLGLGLAIVRHLVELHGGSVSAANRLSHPGAQFEVRLQLAGTRPENPFVSKPVAIPFEAELGARPLAGLRILLVDDDPDSREALRLMLASRGARLEEAGTCSDALASFETQPPDLLISDIGLPGEDGYDLVRRVRALPAERGGAVAAIALTAYASTEDAHRAIRQGYQVHLAKPFESGELVRIVESLVRPLSLRV